MSILFINECMDACAGSSRDLQPVDMYAYAEASFFKVI